VAGDAEAPAQLRLRGLAPARPPPARPAGLGRARPGPRAAGRGDLRAPRRARRPRDLLRARDHGRALPGSRPRDRRPWTRARVPRPRPRTGAPPEPGRVPPRRRALRRAARAARGAPPRRLPRARLLDHPRHALGVRDVVRARLPLRLEPVRLAAGPAPDPGRAARPLSPRAALRTGDL